MPRYHSGGQRHEMDSITLDYTRSSPASNQTRILDYLLLLKQTRIGKARWQGWDFLSCTRFVHMCMSVMIMSMILVCMNNKRLNSVHCSYKLHCFYSYMANKNTVCIDLSHKAALVQTCCFENLSAWMFFISCLANRSTVSVLKNPLTVAPSHSSPSHS